VKQCPQPFREMANHLQVEVLKRFPNIKHIAVAGFIFLRFFCPIISHPEGFGNELVGDDEDGDRTDESEAQTSSSTSKIPPSSSSTSSSSSSPFLQEISPESRRALVLIGKCVQSLASGSKFKEPFMSDMNLFIDQNLNVVQSYLEAISAPPSQTDYEPLCTLEQIKSVELPKLHKKVVQNLDLLGTTLYNYQQEHIIHQLVYVLGELGDVQVEYAKAPTQKKFSIF